MLWTRTARLAPLLALVLTGCGGGSQSSLVIQNKGSDTMVNLAQAWAEAYKAVAPEVDVEVSGGGSGVGVAALVRGTVDIANVSRDLKPDESEQARRNTGKSPSDTTVGYDALAIYVHKDNPLEEITYAQLKGIYGEGGAIERWSDLEVRVPGCDSDTIIRVSRQSSSGTYEFFREHVLDQTDFKLGSRDMNGSKEVVELVSNTPCAIGYSGMGYATPHVKMLKVRVGPDQPAVAPTVAATLDKTYPIARSLHLYTLGEPAGEVKRYLDWILSPAGQDVVETSGYVPVRSPQSQP
jgi:phosphate transport system substrate-binding protein